MGIEKFAIAIRKKLNKTPVSLDKKISTATHIYIDFNAIIHNISSGIIFELNTKLAEKIFASDKTVIEWHTANKKILDNLIISAIIAHINNYIAKAKNAKCIYLAFDGIPEMSKCIEQKRRKTIGYFIGSVEENITTHYKPKLDGKMVYNNLKFSFNKANISAYSEFMKHLYDEMNNIADKRVIISGVDEYGEGEKKIMYKLMIDNIQTGDDILIVSPDADMILLGSIAMYKFSLKNITPYISIYNTEIIDIQDIANYLRQNVNVLGKTAGDILKDFAFMFTFFGNDFLPKILSLSNVDKNIDTLINTYNSIIKLPTDTFVTYSNSIHTINWVTFSSLLSILSAKEQSEYTEYMRHKQNDSAYHFLVGYYDCAKYITENPYYFYELNHRTKNKYVDRRAFADLINANKKDIPNDIKTYIDATFTNSEYELIAFRYKKSIWKYIFNDYDYTDNHISSDPDTLMKEYITGLSYVASWYFDRMMDSSSTTMFSKWFYSYNSAPFIQNIDTYIKKHINTNLAPNEQFIKIKDYFAINEYRQYVEPDLTEKGTINKYISDIMKKIYNAHIDYLKESSKNVYSKYTHFKNKIFADCHNISYLDKCHIFQPEPYDTFIMRARKKTL